MPKRPQDKSLEGADYLAELAQAIGQRIKQRRKRLKLTQELVRVRMEIENVYVTRTQYSRLEKGIRLPNAAEIIALCAVLNVTYAWLLLGTDARP
jgi:transcriptional regulator with XRE-family HTH domain